MSTVTDFKLQAFGQLDTLIEDNHSRISEYTKAECAECGWVGDTSECVAGVDQEGWEMPAYPVDICPACGFIIEDYS